MKRLAFWRPGKRSRNLRSMRPNSWRRHCGAGEVGGRTPVPPARSTHQLGVPLLHTPARVLDVAQILAAVGHEVGQVSCDVLGAAGPPPVSARRPRAIRRSGATTHCLSSTNEYSVSRASIISGAAYSR